MVISLNRIQKRTERNRAFPSFFIWTISWVEHEILIFEIWVQQGQLDYVKKGFNSEVPCNITSGHFTPYILFPAPVFQVITFTLPSFSQIQNNQKLNFFMLQPGSSYSYSQEPLRAPKSASALLIVRCIFYYFLNFLILEIFFLIY